MPYLFHLGHCFSVLSQLFTFLIFNLSVENKARKYRRDVPAVKIETIRIRILVLSKDALSGRNLLIRKKKIMIKRSITHVPTSDMVVSCSLKD